MWINEIKRNLADVLTFSRIIFSPFLLFALLRGSWVEAAIWAFILILTDAYDGIFARKWSPEVRGYNMTPAAFDEAADGVLTNVLIGGVALRFLLADVFSWPEAALSWPMIIMLVVVAGLVTVALIWLTNNMVMPWCKRFEILNGFYYGFLLAVACWIILDQAFGRNADYRLAWGFLFAAVIFVFVCIKHDRLFSRDESKYKGTKTFGDILKFRKSNKA